MLFNSDDQFNINPTANNYIAAMGNKISEDGGRYYALSGTSKIPNVGKSLDGGGGTTGTVSPLTETMGNGTPLTIQPQYITLKFWKRLT